MSSWLGKPCYTCGKKKGPRQQREKYCFTCKKLARKTQSANAHSARVGETYEITGEQYQALYEFQGGRCALCRRATGATRRLSVDHDHKCDQGHDPKLGCVECVRGLLCRPCNNLLGVARDSIEFFQRCIDYLTDPPWRSFRNWN